MIQNKFLVLVIFISIYTKSIYSNAASFDSLGEEYDAIKPKHSIGGGVIGRAFSNIYETVYKKIVKSPEKDAYKNVASIINYDPYTRNFVMEKSSEVSATNVHRTGRKLSSKKRGYIWDGVFDFMRGGFLGEFSSDTGRKPPTGENTKKTPIPLKDDSKSEEDSDEGPLDNFLDGLDDMFSGSPKKKSSVSPIVRPNKVKPKPSSESSESSEGLFGWLTGSDDDDDDDDEDDPPEKLDNKVTSSNYVYSTTPSTTDFYENTMQYSTINEEYYEPTADVSTTLFVDYDTTLPDEYPVSEQNDDFGTTLYEIPTTPATIKTTTPTKSATPTTSTTPTTLTTLTTPTRKPTTIIIRRITTKVPYKPPTLSFSQFVNIKTKPTKGVTNNRPYSITNIVPVTSSMRPHVYKFPVTVPKETIVKKDCVEKRPSYGTITWFPQIFGTSNNVAADSSIPATKPAGWLSYFSSDYADDPEDITEAPSSAVSWFGSFFTEETSTKAPAVIASTTTVVPTDIPPAAASWFDTFLDTEEDDGAYANNITVQPVKKSRRRNYKGFQLLRLHPDVNWKVEDLKDLKEDTKDKEVMWWSTPAVNKSADLLIPADMLSEIKSHLNAVGTTFDVLIWDLQKAITYENPKLSKKQRLELEKSRGHPLTWRRYHRYADILRYMEYLSLKYPDIVELVPLGRSSEGLPIVAAKLTFPLNGSSTPTVYKKKWKLKSKMKPAIWIDGGMHAREWISPAVATWLLHTLVEGEHGNGAEMEMLKIADWYILPVANPDGYEHTHTTDRLWKKTRSNQSKKDENVYFNSWFPWNWAKPLAKECFGTDLNRNWDYHWGEEGSSKDPCSDYYAGPRAFSEPETLAISNFLMENKEQMKVYLSLHSYDQMWVVPTTHTSTPFPDNADLMEMGKLALSALSDVYGTKYQIGSLGELLHPVSGAAHDWAKGQAGIKYSYAIKMRDSYGPYGFLLPGSQITPTAKETWEAIKTIADNL